MKNSLIYLVDQLLRKNKIKIDSKELNFQIQSHPSYPSLHAITGVLSHFNIENLAVEVPVNENTLLQLPNHFLAQVKTPEGHVFVLVNNNGVNYTLVFNRKKSKRVSAQTFLLEFTGIMVAVEKDENNVSIKKSNHNKILVSFLLFLFITLFFITNKNPFDIIHFVLSVIGVGISLLIVQYDLGINSKIVDSICSQESKTTNCETVLNSKGAYLLKSFKLSDISFIYFSAISFAWFLLSIAKIEYNPIITISIITIPAIIYSLYYQAFVAKSWCILCLTVVSILILQAALFPFIDISISNISPLSVLLIVFSFIATTSFWVFIVLKLKNEQDFNKLKIESIKFKRNFELFNTLLEKNETVDTSILNPSEIIFGNKKAHLNITIITNPFCGHCKSVHHLVEDLLKVYARDVKMRIRFNMSTENEKSDVVRITSRLLEIYHTEGEKQCLEAMHSIYNEPKADKWLSKWNDCNNPNPIFNS
ncbi:vitamin K epoxide reductase family protein [Lacinutrix neustonica]|uniref:Vitamin K epoxide reductase family protein n=1 Tax=Lacinutrix neustonica TaxID=2980107 RepID=A0A9E8SEW1_9FLAO|nr:vitamin K epoxide reductase family protein [Lacinutrix neustonica]WAC03636.1 vitamin K epoxide reductase family protein [Lacinutrix neustonica]